jgi:hypothetical protein
VHENLRYAKPQYVIDSDTDLGIHPFLDQAPVMSLASGLADNDLSPLKEINQQLSGLSEEIQSESWWHPAVEVPAATSAHPVVYTNRGKKYFLSLESPVENIPGVSSDRARRLRSLGIHRAGDLLEADRSRIAAITLWDPATVRRVCGIVDLMCRTPQLRPFDAKVLVSCGIGSAKQLHRIDRHDLAGRVESFLASPSGLSLLHTSTDAERVRLRRWLDAMSLNVASVPIAPTRDLEHGDGDTERQLLRKRRKKSRQEIVRHKRKANPTTVESVIPRRFHLELASPVIDAPTIGSRMAERLKAVHVISVGDLIGADAAAIATALNDKNVSPQTVLEWQQQAMLVCRIPNLRGQDAQLLVAAGYTTAEMIANAAPTSLHHAVTQAAHSRSGQRFLRGGNPPDATKTSQWILWAQKCRAVRAA